MDGVFGLSVLRKNERYLCEWIMGWIGAWIGSPVAGHWGWMIPNSNDVYVVPAIIGSLASIYVFVTVFRVIDSFAATLPMDEAAESSDEKAMVA
jgi:uncharacterized membrane protein YeaQ/YmgE (transglycosylase-associated protein family)